MNGSLVRCVDLRTPMSQLRPLPRSGLVAAACGVLALAAARPAAAGPSLTCELTDRDAVEVNGMLDDWEGVARARGGGTDRDASLDVRCLTDGERLMLSIDIRDERVVRARGKGGHDRLELTLAAGGAPLVISLEPGVDGVAPRRRLRGKAVPAWLKVEDSLQERGWAAELVVPLAKLAGWGPGVPSVSLAATVHDVDVAKIASPERTASWSGALTFAQVASGEDGFLRETGLTRADLTLDTRAELDPATKGPERFVAGGDLLAVVGQQYSYVKLPVERATDVLKVELVDLRGDGSRVVLAHLRQRGGGGARQLLTVWGVEGGRLHMLGAVEVGKERGSSRLASTWKLEPAGKWKQARGARKVLVVRPQPAVDWDEDSYAEATATDAVPIHVPWDDDRAGGVVWLDGDTLRDAPLRR